MEVEQDSGVLDDGEEAAKFGGLCRRARVASAAASCAPWSAIAAARSALRAAPCAAIAAVTLFRSASAAASCAPCQSVVCYHRSEVGAACGAVRRDCRGDLVPLGFGDGLLRCNAAATQSRSASAARTVDARFVIVAASSARRIVAARSACRTRGWAW
ncbi:hypothetical protein M885DRAFT_128321 [Pelagophyceae sp. CCMP2097]|nr:hypothetical protein M885DRAFT_128321 [Pelagophyceae sp. CCMP2097]